MHFKRYIALGISFDDDVADPDKNWALMLLQEITDFADEQLWGGGGGGLTTSLTSDALGIALKLIRRKDLVRRKQQDKDATKRVPRNVQIQSSHNRWSRSYRPHEQPEIRTPIPIDATYHVNIRSGNCHRDDELGPLIGRVWGSILRPHERVYARRRNRR